MKHFASASLFALALGATAGPGLAQSSDSPGGFRLPTPTPTPTDVQGPVDPDAPILTRPRAPTPTPTPRAVETPVPAPSQPTPTPTPTQRAVPPPRDSSLPPRFTPPATTTAADAETAGDITVTFPGSAAGLPTPVPEAPEAQTTPGDGPPTGTGDEQREETGGTSAWLFLLGTLVVAGGAAAALWFRRRRTPDGEAAPSIEPPRPAGPTPAAPPLRAPSGPPLLIEARVKHLARSMRFATLSYELRVTNRGALPLDDVTFGGDLVTAHARVPAQAQLADPAVPLASVQTIARLEPGESADFSGELRLPIEEIRPIPHGKAVVYVPLMRVRAEAAGTAPVARTYVVGLKQPGAQRLQPFRLDEMPQTYHAVGQTALD